MRQLRAGVGLGFAVAVAMLLPRDAGAQCVSRKQITGVWKSDDGGTYTVRRIGSVVWWVGESSDGGRSFTNVFRGEIKGTTITGEWLDVRSAGGFKGDTNRGTLTLRLVGTLTALSGFNKVSDTGGFGGKRWFFPCADTG